MSYASSNAPIRTCCVTRAEHPKAALWRFVLGPDGSVGFDPLHKAPGRGVYVEATRATLQQALQKGQLARALGVTIPPETLQQLPAQMAAQLKNLLSQQVGLAKRSSQLVLGVDDVKAQRGKIGLVLLATDLAPRPRAEIERLDLPLYTVGDKAWWGDRLGQTNTAVMGVKKGGFSSTVQTLLLWYSALTLESPA